MPRFIPLNEAFKCENCGKEVTPILYGGSYRNHCPFCLYSKHVDSGIPGDRANQCKGLMEPVGVQTRKSGEYVLLHRCVKCGFERLNRLAGDDNIELATKLSGIPIK